jgi:hypothetical protein
VSLRRRARGPGARAGREQAGEARSEGREPGTTSTMRPRVTSPACIDRDSDSDAGPPSPVRQERVSDSVPGPGEPEGLGVIVTRLGVTV